MKKILTVLTALLVFAAVPVSAVEAVNPVTSFFDKLWKFNDDVDARIDAQQKKLDEQQRKYEEQIKARDLKIQEQQRARKEAYEAQQKRLELKRQQLKQLLEE